ncbi:YaiI/YqxD family protein [Maridesulfovibrio sp.]|uniref:YaiI/YqxD family protein n=1 Tax=Maridesulfovibrio sp. TaxID=2795000 RepID=UPI003BACC1AA
MQIWVDADACPKAVKEILFKTAMRREVKLTLVANQYMNIPTSPFIDMLKVGAGFDVADNEIVKQCSPGDLVITADIPLADKVVEKGATGLNPRGELYTEDNIKGILSMRNLIEELRSAGTVSGGPAAFSPKDKQNFTNQLDKFLTRNLNRI